MRNLLLFLIAVSGVLMLTASPTPAYQTYSADTTACATCHDGFVGGPGHPTHDLHAPPSGFVIGCSTCHVTHIGDHPETTVCAQCHVGPGLRLHHVNAENAPNCTAVCHNPDDPVIGENFAPPLYGTASTSLTDPCADNLDNDGDLKPDLEDPNCTGTPVDGFSWTAFKSLFR